MPTVFNPFQYEWGRNTSQITRSVASYYIPKARSIYFSKDTTSGRTALVGASIGLGVWGSVIFHDHLVFVRVRLIKLNANIIGTTTLACVRPWKVAVCSLIPLGGNIIFASLSWLEGVNSFKGFHLVCSTTRALTPKAKEPMCGLCQLLSLSRCVHGPSGPIVNQIWARNPLITEPLCVLTLKVGYHNALGPQVQS